eukprot:9453747-Lingulodinium_polyedra.AAC.1
MLAAVDPPRLRREHQGVGAGGVGQIAGQRELPPPGAQALGGPQQAAEAQQQATHEVKPAPEQAH